MRIRPEPGVLRWFGKQAHTDLFTTSVSQAEVFYGLHLLPPSKRRDRLMVEAEKVFNVDFAERVLPFESGAALQFALIAAGRRSNGKPISHPDAQIASIARSQKAALATRNTKDFADCGIELIDPWQA